MKQTEHNQTADVEPESTRHTPGPWKVDGSRQTTPQGTDNLLISHGNADTFSPLLAQVYSDGGRLPAQANARLIAAAPELLEMLKEMALVSVWGRSNPLLAKAQDLIQKAETGQ